MNKDTLDALNESIADLRDRLVAAEAECGNLAKQVAEEVRE